MLGRVRAVLTAAVMLSVGAPAAGENGVRSDVSGGDALPHRTMGERRVAMPELSGAPAAGHPPPRGACELAGADRARTPAAQCMVCHDGATGPGIEFQMGAPGKSMSHPVDLDYGSVAARRPDRYEAPGSLPPEVPLVEGRVTCTSCHDGASQDPRRVAIPTRLCQSCHRM